jgi:MFS family permease
MTVPIYVVSLTISLTMGWNADRTNQKPWHIIAATILGAVSFVITATVNVAAVKYAFICFGGAGIWTAVPLFLSWMVGNFEGREKRAVSIAMINGFGELQRLCESVPAIVANDLFILQVTSLPYTDPSSGRGPMPRNTPLDSLLLPL